MGTVDAGGERFERGRKPVLERRGVDPARELAQLRERTRQLVARGRDQRLRRRRVAPDVGLDEPQLHRQRDQTLLGAVVEVALEPAPLGVARGDDALA